MDLNCAHMAPAVLSMDMVQQANSGHPGAPMGMSMMADALFNGADVFAQNPNDPRWLNRSRFILSNGHASALLYSVQHLMGYNLPLSELKAFRQLHSHTPGHPEVDRNVGIETTTGPLGQGIANAVGMALAEKTLAAQFNQPGHEIIDHHTFVFMGDGCLMEGVSHEAASFAGKHQLFKLIALWDDNGISIDGDVQGWFTDDTPKRFESYGWNVIRDVDGHDAKAIAKALKVAVAQNDKPTLICCKTQIGFGSPNKANTAGAHGAPLGEDEIKLVRDAYGWSHEPFKIPEEVYQYWDKSEQGKAQQGEWNQKWQAYEVAYPELAKELLRRNSGALPEAFADAMDTYLTQALASTEAVATRKASQKALAAINSVLPELLGGSADLTGSNCTVTDRSVRIDQDPSGNYVCYGVREFGMSAILNGIALHGGFIPFGATFLVFTDYCRNAIRLSAMMQQRVIYVMTHDSIGVGEDGPTHQPIEHLASLRLIPNLYVWRPADLTETAIAWQWAIESKTAPSVLALSRQNCAGLKQTSNQLVDMKKGGYVLDEQDSNPQIILVATGSEITLALEVAEQLSGQYVVNIVSMPCLDLFLEQSIQYRNQVINPQSKVVCIEAGHSASWHKIAGSNGLIIGIDGFGHSAPAKAVYQHFELTAGAVCQRIEQTFHLKEEVNS